MGADRRPPPAHPNSGEGYKAALSPGAVPGELGGGAVLPPSCPPMADPPRGFSRVVEGVAETVLRDDVAPALRGAGIADPESLRPAASATYRGRGRPFGVDVVGAGRVFVRPYLHGGVLGSLTGDLHAGEARFADELRAHLEARAANVPVCDALGYVTHAATLGLRRGWIVLREIPGARNLVEFLGAGPPSRERRAVLSLAGLAIRALHDAGFDHPDLHLRNLLVDAEGAVRVVDLDRVRRRRRDLARNRRLSGLFRFDRYAAKQAAAGEPVTRADRLRILRAYAGRDWPGREEVRALAARLRRHIDRHRSFRGAGASA